MKGLSNELMQLRKICQHPFLFESVEDKISPGGFIDDKLVRTSGKVELLHRILPKFFATGHRVSPLILFHDIPIDVLVIGSYLLPNDQGHGYHGRLFEDDELETPTFGWWYQNRRTGFICTDV